VEVVTHCDELQVNKADRTEVEVVPHCDELQVDMAVGNYLHFSSIGLIHLQFITVGNYLHFSSIGHIHL
jgi:hypothetical protein